MADLNKIINIKIDFGKGNITVDKLTTSIKDLDKASKNLSNTFVTKVKPAFDNTEKSILSQISNLKKQRAEVAQTAIQYGQFSDRINVLQNELAHLQGKTSSAASGFNNMRNSSGLASQTLVEVGRTISDANYGFTAVANNLSQLGYYFVTLVDQSKGFGNAVKSLGKQFLGAGGLIIAFQLVIFLIEKYTLSQRAAKKATEEFSKSMAGAEGAITKLEQLYSITQDVTASAKDQENALRALKKDGYDKAIGSIEDYIEAKKELLKYSVLEKIASKDLEESFTEEITLRRALAKDIEETEARIQAATDQTITMGTSTQRIDASEVKAGIKSGLDIREKEYEKQIAVVLEKRIKNAQSLNDLFLGITNNLNDNPFLCLLFGDCKKSPSGGSGERRDRLFKERLLNLDKVQEQFRQKSLRDERTTAEELIAIEKRAALSRLEIDYNLYLEREKIRYEEYAKVRQQTIDSDKTTKAQKEQAQRELIAAEATYLKEREEALKSFGLVVKEINKAEKNEFEILERQKAIIFQDLLNERQANELASVVALATNDLNRIDANFALEQEKTAQKIALIEQEKKIRQKAGQDTFIQDQQIANETEALNQKRLQAFEQGEQAKLAIANQVGEAIIAIAGEGSAIGKAVAVAMATINTYEAVTAALGAKPYGPWNIAQAAATAAMGFVQVRNILKTEVPSPKGGSSGAVSAPSIQPPDFNIVGASPMNQVSQAIQGQINQPIKAYVVSKDVSTAQEMDRNIVGTASLG